MLVAAIFAFLFGASLGSFATVVAHRVPLNEGFVTGRSRCTSCGTQIAAYDNVPIASWAVLRGRARCCGERISVRYPLTEISLGTLYVAAVLVLWEEPAQLALAIALFTTLAVVTLTDLEHRVIPNRVLLFSAVTALAVGLGLDPSGEPERLLAAVAAGALLLVVALIYPRGMGMGDVKLIAVMGLYLGRYVAPAFMVALLAGGLVGIGMIAVGGSSARKQAIPFGPYLAAGAVIAALWGQELIDAYADTFV